MKTVIDIEFVHEIPVRGDTKSRIIANSPKFAGLSMELSDDGQWITIRDNGKTIHVPIGNIKSFQLEPESEPSIDEPRPIRRGRPPASARSVE